MPPEKRRSIVLRKKETVVIFGELDSRLSTGLAALNAAMEVLVKAKDLGLITPHEGLEAFDRLIQALTPIISPR